MNVLVLLLLLPALLVLWSPATLGRQTVTGDTDLWDLAQKHAKTHRFSTLFTAQDVRGNLSDDEGRKEALEWCRKTAVTHVYVESFRDGYTAERTTLLKVKEVFEKEGFLVSGCITPTGVGKSSTGWKDTISCYTDKSHAGKTKEHFRVRRRDVSMKS
jgi:hypothetical protein